MKLSFSNIAWAAEQDEAVFALMRERGFDGLEIAPTRIFPDSPYNRLDDARQWSRGIRQRYGFAVSSMQSIWFGREERLFGTEEERAALMDYTKKAIDFAAAIECKNLVFGCPRNRVIPDGSDASIGIEFFRKIGDYAASKNTVIGMEANPAIYGTNYVNTTGQALKLIGEVASDGFKLNLDIGAMVCNGEAADILAGNVSRISHVHISEPRLEPIKPRRIHKEIKALLQECGYGGFVSIEMRNTGNISDLERSMRYVGEVFS